MKAFQGATRTAFLLFFASHIPITLLVDGQVFLPDSFYPQPLLNLVDWYAATFADPLMSRPHDNVWFWACVACEVLFQLPFYCVAVRMLMLNTTTTRVWPEWFRTASLIYGSHTVTTMAPILATLATNPDASELARVRLFGFYLPYLIFPAWLVFLAACGEKESDDKKKKQ